MKVAVIGAGAAGLCAGRHCLEENFSVDIFEQTGNVGGTWNYTDNIGVDENGIPVHSSMYKGLWTKLPKEVMAFEDFPYPEQNQSYLPQEQVLDYITSYAKEFKIDSHVKFYTRVLRVEPCNGLWLMEYENVKEKLKNTCFYNAVIICSGHYTTPIMPEIPGIDTFVGSVKHSHDYRSPECYKDRRVLILGAGPSGRDIAQQIFQLAAEVYVSFKSTNLAELPDCLHSKPLLIEMTGNIAVFEDGTKEQIDDIIFCTGYKFHYPFLSDKCEIKVKDNYVYPLFKQIINIDNPTMGFIGIPFQVCPFPLFGIQVRFFISTINGHYKLPSKEEMLKDLEKEVAHKSARPLRKYHDMGVAQGNYFDDLSNTAKINPVPPVIHKLYMRVKSGRNLNDCFRLIDEENFEQIR